MAYLSDEPRSPIVRSGVHVEVSAEEQKLRDKARQHFNRVSAMPQFQNKVIAVNARGFVASAEGWDELYAELEKKHVNHSKLHIGFVTPPAPRPQPVRQSQRIEGPSEPQV